MTQNRQKNLFATVLTYAAPSSNYRGESEENRTIIQKVTDGRHEYAIISPEAMRNAPGKREVRAQLAGALQAPIVKLAATFKEMYARFAYAIHALEEKQGGGKTEGAAS